MQCKRCGTEEDRIHGYCSVRCEELHELEQENERLRKQKAFLICCIKSGEQLSEKDEKELEEK